MTRFALIASFALGLTLTACQNAPEEAAAGSSDDSASPTAPEPINGDEVVSEGPTDDATPFAGTTDGSGVGGRSGSGASAGRLEERTSSTDTMSKGSASPAGARPPKGSKLQKADPRQGAGADF